MGELANYSIETDHLIWLAFKDGHSLRVPIGMLPRYLTPRDLQKVRRALKLRRDFLRHNMPPTLIMLLAVGVLALAAASTQALALLLRRSPELPGAPRTEIVRNVNPLSPAPPPESSPAATPMASVARPKKVAPQTTRTAARTAARVKPAPSLAPASTGVAASSAVQVTPIVLPAPSPTPVATLAPAPSPSPTPAPTEPPAGQVLGDSTGPDTAPVQ